MSTMPQPRKPVGDFAPPELPTLSPGSKVVFWQSQLYRAVEHGAAELTISGGDVMPPYSYLQMCIVNLLRLLEGSPRAQKLLIDVWDCREDKECLTAAVDEFQAACNALVVYEPEPERPFASTFKAHTQPARLSND